MTLIRSGFIYKKKLYISSLKFSIFQSKKLCDKHLFWLNRSEKKKKKKKEKKKKKKKKKGDKVKISNHKRHTAECVFSLNFTILCIDSPFDVNPFSLLLTKYFSHIIHCSQNPVKLILHPAVRARADIFLQCGWHN